MYFLQLILLFVICGIGPGLFFIRRLRLAPTEKLVAAVAASFLFLFLGTFAVYLLGVDSRWHVALSVVCLALSIAAWKDLRRLFANRAVRRTVAAWGLFAAWGLLLSSFIRHYAGGTWSVDWLEQYQRGLFFLEHRPHNALMGGLYLVPARPPAMNLIATFFLAQTDASYESFQVLFVLLNSLVLLPGCLLAASLLPRCKFAGGRRVIWLLLLLAAANPMVVQNLTYSWTRLFTAFYVVLAIHLYLRGWRKGSRAHGVLSFASMATAVLVHFSAGPFAVVMGLHYLFVVVWRRRRGWVDGLCIAAVCSAIVAPYAIWATATYGLSGAAASNTSISGQQGTAPAGRPMDVLSNVGKTLLPTVLWRPGIMSIHELAQPDEAGQVRDYAFLVYLCGFPWAIGSAGMVLAGVALWRLRRPPLAVRAQQARSRRERWFWIAFVPTTFFLGVAVNPGADRFGIAHICLLPLVMIALAFLAASFGRLPLAARWLIVPGLALDFGVGILLHLSLENRVYDIVAIPNGGYALHMDPGLSEASQANYHYKLTPDYLIKDPDPILLQQGSLFYFGDRFAGLLPLQQAATVGTIIALGCIALRPYLWPASPVPLASKKPRSGAPPTRGGRRPSPPRR